MKHLALLSVTATALAVLFSFFPPTPAPAADSEPLKWETRVYDLTGQNAKDVADIIKTVNAPSIYANYEVKAMNDRMLILQRPKH